MRVIDVRGLRVRYRGAPADAVAGIDFSVGTGEVFGVLGPNGAGKSTIQRVITGAHRDFTGAVSVLGRPVADWGRGLYRRIGVGFELPASYPRLTAAENLAAFAALHGCHPGRVEATLAMLGLSDVAGHRAADFSKGMKTRLNLARALLHDPELLVLDEPTTGLDPTHTDQVRSILAEAAAAGRTVLLTTHDMVTADRLCHRVAFLHRGRLVAVDTPRALRLRHGRSTVLVEYRAGGSLRRAEYRTARDPALHELLASGAVETIHSREASLADVFVAVTGDSP